MKSKNKILAGFMATVIGLIGLSGCNTTQASDTSDALEEIKAAGKLVVTTSPDYAPHEFYVLDENNEKQIVGSDISLAQAIADEIGVELEIVATDFSGVLANIQSSQADLGISGLSKTLKRAEVMQFSDGYFESLGEDYQGLMVRNEDVDKYANLDDLKEANLTIGAQAGSIQAEMAANVTDPANIKQLGTMDSLLLALTQGDVDAVVVSTDTAGPYATTFPDLTILAKDGFNLDPDAFYTDYAVAFPMGDEYQSLIDLVNEIIAEAKANGDIEQWIIEANDLVDQSVN